MGQEFREDGLIVTIRECEENVRRAEEVLTKVLGELVGRTIRWMHNGHPQTGMVMEATDRRVRVKNARTAVTRWVDAYFLTAVREER